MCSPKNQGWRWGRAKNSIERGQDECSDVHHVVSGCSVLGAASMSINARVYVHSTGGTTNRGTAPATMVLDGLSVPTTTGILTRKRLRQVRISDFPKDFPKQLISNRGNRSFSEVIRSALLIVPIPIQLIYNQLFRTQLNTAEVSC
jgi:hypothetical protein